MLTALTFLPSIILRKTEISNQQQYALQPDIQVTRAVSLWLIAIQLDLPICTPRPQWSWPWHWYTASLRHRYRLQADNLGLGYDAAALGVSLLKTRISNQSEPSAKLKDYRIIFWVGNSMYLWEPREYMMKMVSKHAFPHPCQKRERGPRVSAMSTASTSSEELCGTVWPLKCH